MQPDLRAYNFFYTSGALRTDAPSYVKRPADRQLRALAADGQLCYVLTTRQMGKSSLMVHTDAHLQAQGIRTAIIDLNGIGKATIDQWYLSLLDDLQEQLDLTVDAVSWWEEHSSFSQVRRFTKFIQEVIPDEIDGQTAIFLDEIDETLELDFSDDFFAAIRAISNRGASLPKNRSISFILLGVATPNDLIEDRTKTPFNIGTRIKLSEMSLNEAQVLVEGLPGQNQAILERVFYWTNGHPYLTQRVCLEIAGKVGREWSDERVDELIRQLFFTDEGFFAEINLQFIRGRISSSPNKNKLLGLYSIVLNGKKIESNEQAPYQSELKLYGLLGTDEQGYLAIRNRIYRQVFDKDWIKENTSVNWWRRAAIGVSIFAVVAVVLIYIFWPRSPEVLAQAYIDDFNNTAIPGLRIYNLAKLFTLGDYDAEARELFQSLTIDEQVGLFEEVMASEPITSNVTDSVTPIGNSLSSENGSNTGGVSDVTDVLVTPTPTSATSLNNENAELLSQLRQIVQGTYATLYANDLLQDQETTLLLQAMADALEQATDAESNVLVGEMKTWLRGRSYSLEGNYSEANAAYDAAIDINGENPAIYFERAQVNLHLENYDNSAEDLARAWEKELSLKEQSFSDLVLGDREFHKFLVGMPSQLPFMDSIPSPPANPTSTATASASPIETSQPTPPPTYTIIPAPIEGHILFDRISGVPSEIYVMDADGSNVTRLTDNNYHDDEADISPDGKSIAYGSRMGESWHISTMPVDGGFSRRLVSGRLPDWSPDGKLIAYETVGLFEQIGIVNVQTGESWLVTDGERSYRSPSWHFKGGEIATMSRIGDTWQIVILDVDEDTERIITSGSRSKLFPAWSPDGNLIAYNTVDSDGNPDQIWVVDSQGNKARQITNEGHNGLPAWSPNGQYLIFNANMTSDLEGPWLIHRIRIDGTFREVLTEFGDDQRPDWGP